MDSVNPVLLYYDIILMVSVVLSGIYLFMWHKHFDAHITMIFVMIPVICLGYALRVHATGLEAVLAANKLVYLGGCFLQLFVLLAIVNLCLSYLMDYAGASQSSLGVVSAVRAAAHKILALEACSEENGITLNCGVIQGGTVSNVVPEHCSFLVDVRFRNDEQEQRAIACLNEIVGRSYVPGSSSTWEVRKRRPAMKNTLANRKLFELVAKNAADLGLDPLAATESGGGSDSAYTVAVGVPTVCTFGPTGRFIHSVKEQADIASLAERAKLLAVSVLSV